MCVHGRINVAMTQNTAHDVTCSGEKSVVSAASSAA